jgi:superfamily II DNA or RNA helicase
MDSLLETCKGRIQTKNAVSGDLEMFSLDASKLFAKNTICTSIYWATDVPKAVKESCIVYPAKNPMISGSSLGKPMNLGSTQADKPEYFGLPRYLGMSLFGRPKDDRRVLGDAVDVTFQKELFPQQQDIVTKVLSVMHSWGGATLIADCGVGKTGMAIYILSVLKRKACILCNRDLLMTQWAESLLKFLGPVKISYIQGSDHVDVSGDIVIASIGTVIKLERKILSCFGLVIIDEMHHLAAQSLVWSVPLFQAKYTLGLTATPNRSDGLECVLYWLAGPAACVYQRIPELTGKSGTVLVQKVLFSDGLKEEVIYHNGTLGFSSMITKLTEDAKRNDILKGLIQSVLSRKRIIVVTSIVEHAKRLQSFFPDEPSALLAGSHKDRDKAKRVKLVFASYSMLEEGYDDPDLDTLILATPRSTIQQTIGRIERETPGKAVPIVIDLVDNFSLFPNMYWKRQKFYTSRGFSIEIK